jgi:CHAT domain-containing protein
MKGPDAADGLNVAGTQEWFEGDLEASRRSHAEALQINETFLRLDHPAIAETLQALAVARSDLGDLEGARALQERAVAIAERSCGPSSPRLASYLNDLTVSNRRLGNYAEALATNQRALDIRVAHVGPTNQNVATILFNRALLNVYLGDFDAAQDDYNRALKIWQDTLGPEHSYVARTLRQLAVAYGEQDRNLEAVPLFERALAIQEKQPEGKRDLALLLSQYSATLHQLGRRTEALTLSQRAIRTWEAAPAGALAEWAQSLDVYGTQLAESGRLAEAQASFQRALELKRQVLGSQHPSIANTQIRLAAVVAQLGNLDQGTGLALSGDEIGREHLRLTQRYLSERQALEYAGRRVNGTDLALSLLRPSVSGSDYATLWDAVVKSRALTLDEMAQRHRTSIEANRPDLGLLLLDLDNSRRRYANLVIGGMNERYPGQYAALLDATRRERERTEIALAEKSAAFRLEQSRVATGFSHVRRSLPAGASLVAFVKYNRLLFHDQATERVPSYMAFVLGSQEGGPVAVALGNAAAIDLLIRQWHDQASRAVSQPTQSTAAAERAYRRVGNELRKAVWDPIALHLDNPTTVFVVPDGALNIVSFVALPAGPADYMLDVGPTFHYLSTERDLVTPEDYPQAGRGLLALGGASFDDVPGAAPPQRIATRALDAPGAASTMALRSEGPDTPRRVPSDCSGFQSMTFARLPASEREAKNIASLWNSGQRAFQDPERAIVLDGRAADERTFKATAPGQRVLHLATHGFFLRDNCESGSDQARSVGGLSKRPKPGAAKPVPAAQSVTVTKSPLLMSGLALAGANRRASAGLDADDGILTAEEIASLNLQGAEWAVLSACDTGLGEIKAGEGVFGLRRAFQIAGARTVIMSLWSVEDRSATDWMHALYQGRLQKHLDTAEAVRNASFTVLRQRRARGLSTHPFYWAGFVAAGDWR